jgi:hypothetical protein
VLIDGRYKLIQKLTENSSELYDLKEDPTEQKNLAGHDPHEKALERVLKEIVAGEDRG